MKNNFLINKFHKKFMICIFLCLLNCMFGITVYAAETWSSGNIAAKTYSSNQTVNLTGNVTLNGRITINSGVTLKILGSGTITRGTSNTDFLFKIEDGGALVIGDSSSNIVLEGKNIEANSAIYCDENLTLTNVTIKNNCNAKSTNAGGVTITSKTTVDSKITITNCKIINCKASAGSAMYLGGSGAANVVMSKSIIENCTNIDGSDEYGGTIRTNGSGSFKMTMKDCVLRNNSSKKFGGVMYWIASRDGAELKVEDCQFLNNYAGSMGGAIFIEGSKASFSATSGTPTGIIETGNIPSDGITGTLILNNSTGVSGLGGGICFKCYSNTNAIKIPETNVTLGENVFVQNNTAGYGGGVAFALYESNNNYEVGSKFTFNIEGAKIENNEAINGGGVYILKGRNDYISNTYFKSGSISNNVANSGGAIYITAQTGLETGGDFYMTGGTLKNNKATTESGGAIYIDKGNYVMSEVTNASILKGNTAVNGGAIYVNGGNFTMKGGKIEENRATESGGGIKISDGNVYITNGSILSNVARGESTSKTSDIGYGGGLFVDGCDTVEITGGEILNNIAAKNGGGIEIKTDKEVTIDIYSGVFSGNVADECGGALGIECDNGTINLGEKDCDGSSSSSHSHPVLTENLAGIHGAGFYMNGTNAKLNIYCSFIDNNKIGDVENNFEQLDGIVTVCYGVKIGEENEGVIVIGGIFIDERATNEEKSDIYYYSNYDGSSKYKNAQVTYGTLITLPGNIFDVEGYEVLGWTTDSENTTIIEYDVGEVVAISENISLYAIWIEEGENAPTYIVYIPAEIKLTQINSVESFCIDATVEMLPRNQVLRVEILEEDFELELNYNGSIVEYLDYELSLDEEKLTVGDTILEIYSDSPLIVYNENKELEIYLLEDEIMYAGSYEDLITFNVLLENI